MSHDVVIQVEGVWKRYGLPLAPTLRRLSGRLRGKNDDGADGPWALKGVSFEVKRGETLGVIGRNGAGKSTLLKILAGVTPPTRGKVRVQGCVFPMIELNAGLHQDLTGRENVRLLGAIMGLTRAEIEAKMPDIEAFCELDDWFDRPVRKYSSGMLARLGFGVAVNVDADILLVDEVLAVGDMTFQRKCFNRIEWMHHSGKTVLLVSHSLRQVERLCDRALLLDSGEQVALGDPVDVISQYHEAVNARILEQVLPNGEKVRVLQDQPLGLPVEILDVRLLDANGQPSLTFYTDSPLTIEVEYQAHEPVEHANIGFDIMTIDAFYVSGFTNETADIDMPLRGRGKFRCTIPSLPLLAGIYTLNIKIKHLNEGILGGGSNFAMFTVQAPPNIRVASYGLLRVHTQWSSLPTQEPLGVDHS